ncbi:MAG: poly-gamma-glutamate system protein [Myxococcales bacterium]|nr:poly-gamma-glutamate system protein [Myxococcales bacterium]
MYWRPAGVSRKALLLVALVALAALAVVESFPVVAKQSRYADKLAAARLAQRGMEAIKAEKIRLGHRVDPKADPAETGLIGESITPVTSNTGFLDAKRTGTDPNFAAVILHLLDEAQVKKGDLVAVAVSGSFPGLNLATYAALTVIEADAIILASASSSEWGANHVDYLWVDMERTLREQKITPFKTAAATYGGIDDIGIGLTEEGRSLIDAALERNGIRHLRPESLAASIDRRAKTYEELAGDRPIKAYVNVGGGSASVGTHVGKKQFRAGLNTSPPSAGIVPDSVMLRFAERDIPVIHISRVKILAERYGLPYGSTEPAPIGRGRVFVATQYNKALTFGSLLVVLAVMVAFLRFDVGSRVLSSKRAPPESQPPERMV